MSKLTAPAPQNRLKRKRFFENNPEFPGAAAELDKIFFREHGYSRKEFYSKQAETYKKQVAAPKKVSPTKSSFLNKVQGFFKSQRGN